MEIIHDSADEPLNAVPEDAMELAAMSRTAAKLELDPDTVRSVITTWFVECEKIANTRDAAVSAEIRRFDAALLVDGKSPNSTE